MLHRGAGGLAVVFAGDGRVTGAKPGRAVRGPVTRVGDGVDRLNKAPESRYRIERELGAGGMATVYLAEDLRHDRKVALEVLNVAARWPDRVHIDEPRVEEGITRR